MVLSRSRARAFYDRFGARQDAQAFYEDAALDELVRQGDFGAAERVVELGCGTGRFAARLLAHHLAPQASYLGLELSETMTRLARERLAGHDERARVVLADGAARWPLADRSADRVVSTYVLDLLSEASIARAIEEAARVLRPGGRLCLVSLTRGQTLAARIVSTVWSGLFRLRPEWVGGCRPMHLEPFLQTRAWSRPRRWVVTRFAVPSEVLVATRSDCGPAASAASADAR